MSEMTDEKIKDLNTADIIKMFRTAAQFQREHKAITWEHGTDLVNIIAIRGDFLAEAMEATAQALFEEWFGALEEASDVATGYAEKCTKKAAELHRMAEFSVEQEMLIRSNEASSIAASIRALKRKP